jgi:hypothetical protein
LGDKIKEDEMGWARGMHWGEEWMQNFGGEWECVDWIYHAQDRDRTVVNVVMNTELHTTQEFSQLPYELLASQKTLLPGIK